MSAADVQAVSDGNFGGEAGGVEGAFEIDVIDGLSRYRDPVTRSLGLLASTWESLHKAWQATEKRAAYGSPHLQVSLAGYAEALRKVRDQVGAKMTAELRKHPLWPWLETHPGVRGVHVARVLSMIGDPLRFPGRMCPAGHHAPADQDEACSARVDRGGKWESCGEQLGPVRPGTGTRSLWHYLGLHVVEGHLARKRKGYQATWNPTGRTALLQPDGVADQIIKLRVAPWRAVYDATKARVAAERGADMRDGRDGLGGSFPAALVQEGGADAAHESELPRGPALSIHRGPADPRDEIDVDRGPAASCVVNEERNDRSDLAVEADHWNGPVMEGEGADTTCVVESIIGALPLRPIQIHQIARTVAVKAFVADLLAEWKRAVIEGGDVRG